MSGAGRACGECTEQKMQGSVIGGLSATNCVMIACSCISATARRRDQLGGAWVLVLPATL